MIQLFASSTILLSCILLFLPTDGAAQGSNLHVVATTSIIADTVRIVAGDDAEVGALMGEGVDPHLYKASPGDVRKLSNASLILHNGLHLEGKMGDILSKLGKRKPVAAVTDTLEGERLRKLSDNDGAYDPHVWFDVSLWEIVTSRIERALSEVAPAHERQFAARSSAYRAELRSLHEWVKSELSAIPRERRVLVTAHDAFGYFGRAYSMDVLGIQGISTDSEASIQDVNHLVDLIVTRKVPAVFVESSISQKTVQALIEGATSRGHGVKIGGELFSDALGAAGTPEGTYVGMVKHNVKAIVGALK